MCARWSILLVFVVVVGAGLVDHTCSQEFQEQRKYSPHHKSLDHRKLQRDPRGFHRRRLLARYNRRTLLDDIPFSPDYEWRRKTRSESDIAQDMELRRLERSIMREAERKEFALYEAFRGIYAAIVPTLSPTKAPTVPPTCPLTPAPVIKTIAPILPTINPAVVPSARPVLSTNAPLPVVSPTASPVTPTVPAPVPTIVPTAAFVPVPPSLAPAVSPTVLPVAPTAVPIMSAMPTVSPSNVPSSALPSASPTAISRVAAVVGSVALFGGSEFGDPHSYQSQALSWLEKSTNVASLSDARIVQRYALACIYYATFAVSTVFTDDMFGPSYVPPWISTSGWLTEENECMWARIGCDSSNQVIILDLVRFLESQQNWVLFVM